MSVKTFLILLVSLLVGLMAMIARGVTYQSRFAATPDTTPVTVEIRWRTIPTTLDEALGGFDWQEVIPTAPESDPSCYRVQFDAEPGYFELRYRDENDRTGPWSKPMAVPEPPSSALVGAGLLFLLGRRRG